MNFKKAFTLAEVLITLTLIGVVAALTIPAVISNAQQVEYKTGLKKAVAALDEAVQLNIAIEGENPYQNNDLFKYLQRHMTVVSSTPYGPEGIVNYSYGSRGTRNNRAFYTKDGIRYEIYEGTWPYNLYDYGSWWWVGNGKCGNVGVSANSEERYNWNDNGIPCVVVVDVNGDKKPHPSNFQENYSLRWGESYPSAYGNTVTDIFMILITKDGAVPYGTLAQKVMYSGAQRSRYY